MATHEPHEQEKLLLNAEEAAALLGVSRGLIYQMITRRELPHVRLGQRVVVPRRELEVWIREQVQANLEPVPPARVRSQRKR
jgi:excisionase family DNA binding protein